jgi:membrane protein DedA with SNARE-associated domain
MGITEFLAQHIMLFFQNTGYFSLFIFMAMESMVFPVPSEAVLPPAGLLIARNIGFNLPLAIIVATAASIVGSYISYIIGSAGGKPFIKRFGKFLLLDEHELDVTAKYFEKRGEITVLICRFIPVIRHLISIPAGLAKMKLSRFLFFTVIGASIWNSFLILVGYFWGEIGWKFIIKYSKYIDYAIVAILLGLIGLFVYKQIKNRQRNKKNNTGD